MAGPTLSIIVPSLKLSSEQRRYLALLRSEPDFEVIIVTPKQAGVANRAQQMNYGARQATGEVLVFLHADTVVNPEDLKDMASCLAQDPDLIGGAFRFALDSDHWRASIVEWGVLLRELIFRIPYGDQALFVRRKIFKTVGGYPDVPILEDVFLVEAIKRHGPLLFYPAPAVTSARRWDEHGYLKTTLVNWATMALWRLGLPLEHVRSFREQQIGTRAT